MLTEVIEKMQKEISEKSRTPEINRQALHIFHSSYYIHKDLTGSYSNCVKDYEEKLRGRYDFMFSKAMEYIMEKQ